MGNVDDATRTMRISLKQEDADQGERRRTAPWRMSGAGGSTFNAKKEDYRERRSEYEHLLESIYDAVLITGLDGIIMEANGRAREFFLSDDPALQERSVLDLVEGADDRLLDAIDANLQEHRYTLVEAMCVRYDGSVFPAEIAVNRIELHDEAHLCFFIRNISVRKEALDALERAIAQLKEHDQARAQFVSNVSHELKTPLTSILYAIHNMLSGVVGPIPDRVRTYLKMLDGDVHRMLTTVNDILDIRKVENQTLTLDYQTVPFGGLVVRSLESLLLQAKQKGVALDVETAPGALFVRCDVPKMERVILNVVGNAVKFTPEGGSVRVEVCRSPADGRYIEARVSDTGIGIPANALPNVAKRYYTVGDQPIGSGLGLAISSEILNLHGGTMSIESPVPGERTGTRVTITLASVPSPHVMVVAAESVLLDALRRDISDRGYSVLTCAGADEALVHIQDDKPDLLVLDLQLPHGRRAALVAALQDGGAARRVPVLGVAAEQASGAAGAGEADGVTAVLVNPWTADALGRHLDDCLLGDV